MTGKLEAYNKKRDPDKTPEPEGNESGSGDTLRFVVQHHRATRNHYDFRLEWEGVLLSWAVPKGPSFNPEDKRLAVEVEDHPMDYRNFEGTIPKGQYGGGVVMLWDEGEWEPQGDVSEGLKKGSLKFTLKGSRLKGNWALVRLKEKEDKKNWLLIKEKDRFAEDDKEVADYDTSIRTNRTMKEIEEDKDADRDDEGSLPFEKTNVQLAKLVNKVPKGENWVFELKYDGYRILAYIEDNQARLISRNGKDYTSKFKSIADSLGEWSEGRSMVLDGEVVILDKDGKTDFSALQGFLKSPKGQSLTYMIFDLLALSGKDLRGEPLKDRKEKLSSLLENPHPDLHYSKHVDSDGKDIFKAACKGNMEGIICKKEQSIYSGTRNGDWLKVKCENRQEFVIGGYTLTDKRKSGVSALLLGVYEGEDLIYVGRAGTGFTQKTMKELEEQFEKIKRKTPPFKEAPKERSNEKVTWLSPELVAEIQFAEWTGKKQLRQASFKGLRTGNSPKEVAEEAPAEKKKRKSTKVKGIRISSPDKEMFEGTGITKEDVARYYEEVSERMLPYAANRLLSVLRCPDGFPGECFYQRHPGESIKGLQSMKIKEKDNKSAQYFYLEDAKGLLRSVQMGTLEFHPWGSRVENVESPDLIVFDLDPAEGMELEQVREGVRDLKELLDELSLTAFLKTSGGKGYHVVVPVKPSVDWSTVKTFAKNVALAMEQRWPDRYTSNMRKEKRKGKIFIDWVRNGRSATSVAPYSVRARKGAPVSMPIAWEELESVAPNGIDISAGMERLKKEDPWVNFYEVEQKLVNPKDLDTE